jgi:hypothetical protein
VDIVRQSHNQVGGDLVSGNKSETTFNLINAGSVDELTLLYQKLKENGVGDPSGGSFCEQLEHYLSVKTDGDVRGLEAKLKESGRSDQLGLATSLKERAAKAVMIVSPAIQEDAGRREVDQCIQQVLQTTKSMLGENVLEITVKDLLALLYFLGGNCHIRWDKC